MTRPPDHYNPDDWDGTDFAEEMFDAEKRLLTRIGQGARDDLASQHEELAPLPGYIDSWQSIAADVRQRARYRCERCGVELRERRYLLHAHHLDRNKLNNDPSNLIALCVLCHADRDNHRHLLETLSSEDRAYLEELRRMKKSPFEE